MTESDMADKRCEKRYMELAIELAEKGCGRVNPNPMVGAVIVKDGRIIGQGYHARYGEFHAERAALAACTEDPAGADMYVTLEPCCHYGKQPPCTEAIIESGIKHVIIGSDDPNELVAGKGIEILESKGISVTRGFMKAECDAINSVFFHYITTGLPYVVMKYAMTMDGKIAAYTGKSKWITGEAARKRVHEDRNRYAAIMAGIGTVLKDDPMLNCRIPEGSSPIRIICDTHLRIPVDSQIVKTAGDYRTIIAAGIADSDELSVISTASVEDAAAAENERMTAEQQKRREALQDLGCEVLLLPTQDGHVDLYELMKKLGSMKIDSVFVEGGAALNWSALEAGIVNKIQTYIAPKILGGRQAPSPVSGCGADEPDSAVMLSEPEITRLGNDILLESEVISCLRE